MHTYVYIYIIIIYAYIYIIIYIYIETRLYMGLEHGTYYGMSCFGSTSVSTIAS